MRGRFYRLAVAETSVPATQDLRRNCLRPYRTDIDDARRSIKIPGGGILKRDSGQRLEQDLARAIAPCGCASADPIPEERKAIAVDPHTKTANLRRLKRIEGQIRGIQKMIEGDRYCPDIIVQVSAVQEALRTVGRQLMRNHLR